MSFCVCGRRKHYISPTLKKIFRPALLGQLDGQTDRLDDINTRQRQAQRWEMRVHLFMRVVPKMTLFEQLFHSSTPPSFSTQNMCIPGGLCLVQWFTCMKTIITWTLLSTRNESFVGRQRRINYARRRGQQSLNSLGGGFGLGLILSW